MTAEQVIESLDNAWRALCIHFDNSRDESIRIAMNKLAGIIAHLKSEYEEAKKQAEKEITMFEWIEWLNSDEA